MDFKKPEFILVLFITFIIASYVELNFGYSGSPYLAVFFFIISLILLVKLREPEQTTLSPSRKLMLLGSAIIIVDILYNIKKGSDFQTLDTMLIFLGISLISLNIKNKSISSVGEFGVYFSSYFLVFFLIVYALPSRLGLNIYDYYGYYATTKPAILGLQSLGLSLHLDSFTTFHAHGIEDIYYKIDLGCFGFYSMLLILSTMLSYRKTSASKNSHSLIKISLILVIISFMSNLLRIMILVSIGYYYGLETMEIFHTFLGWALFTLMVMPVAYFYMK